MSIPESAAWRRRFMGKGALVAIVAGLVLACCCGGPLAYSFGTEADVTITVTDKERVSDGSDSKYLVFTEDEVFQNTDAPLHKKWTSSDLYNMLEIGGSYDCEVNGLRLPLFSQYRNLLSCEPAGTTR